MICQIPLKFVKKLLTISSKSVNMTVSHINTKKGKGGFIMTNLNFFSLLCFFWALVGIGSRIIMAFMGEKWNQWELNNAYAKKKPTWIYLIGGLMIFLIGFTWYQVFTTDVKYDWIIAALVSLTGIKVSTLLFQYDQFRKFVAMMLSDKKKMLMLNVSVVIFSIVLIWMGIYVY